MIHCKCPKHYCCCYYNCHRHYSSTLPANSFIIFTLYGSTHQTQFSSRH